MDSGYKSIKSKIELACLRSNRQLKDVSLIAVSKKQSIEKIQNLYNEGQRVFAENYVQEFSEKIVVLQKLNIIWHMIGPLQANKVNKIVGKVDCIHSIDDMKILKKISSFALTKGTCQNILLQVNLAEESSKGGVSRDEVPFFLKEAQSEKGVCIKGLMCMPPLTENAEISRLYFKELKKIQLELKKDYPDLEHLSMGTTQDFEAAIEEGATYVRIGEALFGKRIF